MEKLFGGILQTYTLDTQLEMSKYKIYGTHLESPNNHHGDNINDQKAINQVCVPMKLWVECCFVFFNEVSNKV